MSNKHKPDKKYLDKYLRHAAFLSKYPKEIRRHWLHGVGLFAYCESKQAMLNYSLRVVRSTLCGCPTMLKYQPRNVLNADGTINKSLTNQIRKDKGIPRVPDNIKPRNLKRFAHWQAMIDTKIRNEIDTEMIESGINFFIQDSIDRMKKK